MSSTFLTTEQLSTRIQYDARTIREQLKDSVLIEGVHYVRPFGRRKNTLYMGNHRKGYFKCFKSRILQFLWRMVVESLSDLQQLRQWTIKLKIIVAGSIKMLIRL